MNSIESVDNILLYLKGRVGVQSNNVVNRLISLEKYQRKSIVSRFAAVNFAIIAGPDLIRNLVKVTRQDGNPSMDGWMLEMWFFASLRNGGVKLFDENDKELETWQAHSQIETIDQSCFPDLPDNGWWYTPSKWNQGGFDAILVDKGKKFVKFVQMTGAKNRSFKTEYFRSFLNALSHSPQSFEVKRLVIVFVVDFKKRDEFRVATPSVEGLLDAFEGWKKGKELEKVQTVFIKGWSS